MRYNITFSVGKPARNKHYRQAIAPKRGKNDITDAYACSRFAIVERPAAAWVVPEEFQLLCQTVRRLESQARQATRTINGLHNPAVKALYDRLRARGKRGDVACGIHGNVLDFWAAWRRLPPREMD